MAKRPRQIPVRPPLSDDQKETASYVGSPEHKVVKWWGGLPDGYRDEQGVARRPGKQTTTICPLTTEEERDRATQWVVAALKAGQFRFYEGDKDFPKRIWYKSESGQLWAGFCINGILGTYKGWPIDEEERVEIFC